MPKRMVTRSITAPTLYSDVYPKGLHLPGTTIGAVEKLIKDEGGNNKIVVETRVYEMSEETFVQNACIREDKSN